MFEISRYVVIQCYTPSYKSLSYNCGYKTNFLHNIDSDTMSRNKLIIYKFTLMVEVSRFVVMLYHLEHHNLSTILKCFFFPFWCCSPTVFLRETCNSCSSCILLRLHSSRWRNSRVFTSSNTLKRGNGLTTRKRRSAIWKQECRRHRLIREQSS